MKLDLVSLLEPDILALKLIGFWESSKEASFFNRFYYRTYRGVIIVSTTFYIIFAFMYLYEKRETLTVADFNAVMFIQTTNVTNAMMVTCIFLNSKRLHAMVCQLESAAFQPKSQKENSHVYEWKISSYLIKKLFYGVNGFMCTIAPIVAMLQGKTAPLATYIPPWIHWRVYFWFQSTVSVYNATMASIYISTLCTLLIEAIIQIACLKERLQCTEDRNSLIECIQRYFEITVFTNRLQHICKIGLSVVFICGVINICTTLSRLHEVDFIDLIFMVPYLSEMVMIIYVHCFYGSILASESEGVGYSSFSSKWVNTDVSHKRTLAIFMIYSSKQLSIKLAGGTLTMTLPLFVQIIRTAYTYYTVLQTME